MRLEYRCSCVGGVIRWFNRQGETRSCYCPACTPNDFKRHLISMYMGSAQGKRNALEIIHALMNTVIIICNEE